ncbi:hypothetical protein BDFB_004971 [Asbolus verrucosus]|uniref:Uncharacterized protein n=1 Tax=Asbolus verrucosus TaxID=1661398 RepID=A0A482VFZ5_ASBVE|nr:hypothetical protein BDFB_004971 [Asbolus verrucosus]
MIFTTEHKIFITESYFRNGVIENGEWRYSSRTCLQEFRQNNSIVCIKLRHTQT